ncbi:InlB B-repeat-containing protein [Enterococcus sp. CSURQ0835]|uniref:InlB B-repeat-containing protein n=1 Tax=Enterococcus sp. CSURQ0835 TaxID=2681394 RepID=UPI00135B6456|nr:InlB B-repeat-containing protein [Enterococcus sp. CSURQ0835]
MQYKGKFILLASLVLGFQLSMFVPGSNQVSGSHVAYAAEDEWKQIGDFEVQGDPSGFTLDDSGKYPKSPPLVFTKGGNYTIKNVDQIKNSLTGIYIKSDEPVNLTFDQVKIQTLKDSGTLSGIRVFNGVGHVLDFVGDCQIRGSQSGLTTYNGTSVEIRGNDPLIFSGAPETGYARGIDGADDGPNYDGSGQVTINRGPTGLMEAQGAVFGIEGNATINSGNIKVMGDSCYKSTEYSSTSTKKLQINGGKVQLGDLEHISAGIQIINGSTFEMNGGEVISDGAIIGLSADSATKVAINGGTLTLRDGEDWDWIADQPKPNFNINGGSVKFNFDHYGTIAPVNHSFGTLDGTNITLPTTVQLPGQKAFELTDHHPNDNNFYFYLENGANRIASIGDGDQMEKYLFKWDAANQKFEPGVLIPKPVFDTTDLPAAVVGDVYNQTITAKNADSYELDGKLPTGMNFDAKTGALSGTPTEAGTYTVTIKANNLGWDTEKTFTLQVKNKYTVTFDPAGGGRIFSETVIEGDSLKKPADPKRADYTFLGWFPEKDLNHSYDFTKPVTENMTLQAGWRHNEAPIEHETITFDSNGGSSITPLTVRKGERLQKPTDPTKKGYTFDGWYTDAALTKAYDFNQPIETNFTLYAKWKSETPEDAGQEPLYRLYNPNSGEHFYTKSAQERDWLISLSWKDEGTAWITPKKGTPVYRVYNPNSGEHFYTKDAAERDDVVKAGWRDEGIGFYSDETNKAVPIYRVFNPNAQNTSSHLFTKSQAEVNWLTTKGWLDENIAFYGVEPAGAE